MIMANPEVPVQMGPSSETPTVKDWSFLLGATAYAMGYITNVNRAREIEAI